MSDRSIYVRVRDKKTGLERDVTKKAYELLGPRRYELLSGDVQTPTIQKTQKKSEPVVEPAEGDQSIEPTTTSEPQGTVTVIRRKPGPKPKNNA